MPSYTFISFSLQKETTRFTDKEKKKHILIACPPLVRHAARSFVRKAKEKRGRPDTLNNLDSLLSH